MLNKIKFIGQHHYGALFLSLILLLVIAGFGMNTNIKEELFLSAFFTILITSLFSLYEKSWQFYLLNGLGFLCISLSAMQFFSDSLSFEIFTSIVDLIFLIGVMASIFIHIFNSQRVNTNIILGGASLYLLIGITFSYIYMIVDFYVPNSFLELSHLKSHGVDALFSNFIYYSFVTLTSLGYGDITPLSQQMRFISVLEAMFGQLYLVVLMARLVNLHLTDRKAEL